jgi:uncharacterized membrane protein YeaQ/YmgE (transglycosylase-associated protein family)
LEILVMILVGLIAGGLAGRIMRGSGFGLVGDVVVGLIGALIGSFVLSLVGFPTTGNILYAIVVALLGAVILLWLVGLFTGRRTTV